VSAQDPSHHIRAMAGQLSRTRRASLNPMSSLISEPAGQHLSTIAQPNRAAPPGPRSPPRATKTAPSAKSSSRGRRCPRDDDAPDTGPPGHGRGIPGWRQRSRGPASGFGRSLEAPVKARWSASASAGRRRCRGRPVLGAGCRRRWRAGPPVRPVPSAGPCPVGRAAHSRAGRASLAPRVNPPVWDPSPTWPPDPVGAPHGPRLRRSRPANVPKSTALRDRPTGRQLAGTVTSMATRWPAVNASTSPSDGKNRPYGH
jgi:hypothetical protein